jgi:hypothetical protein
MPNADQWILSALQYLYDNPIFTGIILGIAGWIAGKTKTKLDDRIVERVGKVLGRDVTD